jgi:hypothetical protein
MCEQTFVIHVHTHTDTQAQVLWYLTLTNSLRTCKGKSKKKKGKAVPLRSIEAHLGDRRYSSYSFLTSALAGGEWSASSPGRALPPGKPYVRVHLATYN